MKKTYEELEQENNMLRMEIEYLKTHPSILTGINGEKLILNKVGGRLTSYAASYDIELKNGIKIEVKNSKLDQPNKSASTLRWSWSNVLGSSASRKEYDYLILIGEKDPRYGSQYYDGAPYVFFVLPRKLVEKINPGGGHINLTTNFKKFNSRNTYGHLIVRKMVKPNLIDEIEKSVANKNTAKRIIRTSAHKKFEKSKKRINRTYSPPKGRINPN